MALHCPGYAHRSDIADRAVTLRWLGAIIAGGASRRFGEDKALAMLHGRRLIEHATDAIAGQVDAMVICGREWREMTTVADRPGAGLGPLGGLNAALHHARVHGFDIVMSIPVDVYPLPGDLRERLGSAAAATFARQTMVGCWPVSLAPLLDAHLAAGHRSIRSWIGASGARAVDDSDLAIVNINRTDDLSAAQHDDPASRW